MIRYASSEDTLHRLSQDCPTHGLLNSNCSVRPSFYDTGNFNKHQRCEALEESGGMPPQKILKSESLKTQFPALSG